MATTKKKQSAKQKRILIASIVLAAAITIGGTFAWFTSSDRVTNRLTASADYGVSITEDFTPPEDWVPGQVINKDVGAINTGNVSAFVKLTVTNAMTITTEATTETAYGTIGKTYIELKQGTAADVANGDGNEVLATEAGGYLVAKPSGASEKLGKLGTKFNADPGKDTNVKPSETGVYIFRRAVTSETELGTTDGTTAETWVYSGFYYDSASDKYYEIKVTCGTEPTYGTAADGEMDTVTEAKDATKIGGVDTIVATDGVFTVNYVTEEKVNDTHPTFTYDATNSRFIATYAGKDTSSDKGDVVIYINLKSGAVDTTTPANGTWTYDSNNSTDTSLDFYLNSILAPGKEASDLIDSVGLADTTKEGAYKDFTYDLNINLNSVQAVYDTDGNISTKDKSVEESVKTAKTIDTTNVTDVTVTPSTTADKTGTVEWTFKTSTP